MFKTRAMDCGYLLERLYNDVPQHVTSGRLDTNLIRRISKRILIQAIFEALPNDCIMNNLNMRDYRLMSNVEENNLQRIMDNTTDLLKSCLYHKNIDISNYAFLSCTFDGQFLHLKLGVEKCTTNSTQSMLEECYPH